VNRVHKYALAAGVVAGFLAVGIPYWMIPYGTINLPNALYGLGLYLVGAVAFLLCLNRIASFGKVTCVIGASVPAAVFARVLVEGIMDPSSHNLWPLEIGIALITGLICSLAGSIPGSLLARMLPTRDQGANT
jgi:hypothetical protein